jgi:hypothetical protein
VGAVLFYRNADHFCEQRLDDQTGVRVVRRYRRKRTTLAANERLPARLVKCDCSAQFLQQIKGGQESFVSALLRELIAMFFRQRSTDLAHARPKFPRTKPLADARHKMIKQQSICFRKNLLGVGRKPIRRVRLSKTGSTSFTLNQTIAFETDQVRSDGIVCQFQGGGEFIDGARFDPKQSENLPSRTIKHSLAPSLRFHKKSLVRRLKLNIY